MAGSDLARCGEGAAALRLVVWARTRLYREGLAESLLARTTIKVVGTVADASECFELVASGRAEAVLVDASLPDAVASIGRLTTFAPEVHVVALAVPEREDAVLGCIEAGAVAFVTVDESMEDLLDVLNALKKGEARCSPRMVAALMRRVSALAAGRDRADVDGLTARELEIGRLIGDGLSNKEIATRLHIEIATVKNHVHRVLTKLGVDRRSKVGPRLRELGLGSSSAARN
jgi:two-component system, NarL family, nitrate/nitrite response regulator NarL